MTILTKRIFIIFFLITALAGFSGCVKKSKISNNVTPVDQQAEELVKSEQIVATTTDNGDYEIIPRGDGWITFKSYACGFEISYPGEFEWSGHCEEIKHPVEPFNLLIGISNHQNFINDIYGGNGEMGINFKEIKKDVIDLEAYINNNFQEGISYSSKLGNKKTTIKEDIFNNSKAYYVDLTYSETIEGPEGEFKYFYFSKKNKLYNLAAQIPYNNIEMENILSEIIKTIKFID